TSLHESALLNFLSTRRGSLHPSPCCISKFHHFCIISFHLHKGRSDPLAFAMFKCEQYMHEGIKICAGCLFCALIPISSRLVLFSSLFLSSVCPSQEYGPSSL